MSNQRTFFFILILVLVLVSLQVVQAASTLPTLRPTADGSSSNVTTNGSTPYYTELDDDPDSADTVYVANTGGNAASLFVELTDMPSNFQSMATLQVDVDVTPSGFASGNGRDSAVLYAQVFQSNESTNLTEEVQVANQDTSAGLQSVTFSSVTASDKTTWDGARLRLRWTYTKDKSSDNAQIRANAAELDGTYSPSLSFEQSAYRFFANNDSTDVGSALAAQNTAVTLTSAGQNFRLRGLLHVSGSQLAQSGQDFTLQFAEQGGGTCASPTGSWADVGAATAIAYTDNTTPADGDALTANSGDPDHSGHTTNNQTYEEANTFTNSQSAIAAGADGLWDFSLQDNAAPEGTTYCLRVTKSGGSGLSTYTQYPAVTTYTPPESELTSSAYRFFANNDSTDVGSALAAQNTAVTLTSAGQNFRLRQLLHVSNATLPQSEKSLALQFADKSGYGSCSAIPAGDFAAVADSAGGGGAADGSQWSEATSAADWTARNSHTSVVYDSTMWVLGGSKRNDVWYSSDGVTWTEATGSAGWSGRNSHTSVVYDSTMWVLGGNACSTSPCITRPISDVWYSSDGITWSQATASAGWAARSGHTSVVYDGKMWVLGGNDGSNFLDDVWYSSDGITWSQATASAGWAARSNHTSVVYNDKMWVLGGSDGSNFLDDVWYSSDGVTWTEATGSAGWSGRNSHTSVVYDSTMWVLGGSGRNDVWYSSDGVTWTEATGSAGWSGRNSHTSVVYDSTMWVLGGSGRNDVWYSEATGSTIAYADNPTPTDGAALTANSGDPDHSGHTTNNQTYEEANTFTNSQSAISAGEDGLWDFSLTVAAAAPTSTSYCLRPTSADGTALTGYDVYPEVTTYDGSGTGGTVSCQTSASSTDFGTIASDSVYTATPDATTTVSCTSDNGCLLYVKDTGDGGSAGGLYNSTDDFLIASQTETLAAGSEGYGIQAATSTAGSGGTLTLSSRYEKTGTAVGALDTTDIVLASSSAAVTDREVAVTHKAVISNLTTSGNYADTITYSCITQ